MKVYLLGFVANVEDFEDSHEENLGVFESFEDALELAEEHFVSVIVEELCGYGQRDAEEYLRNLSDYNTMEHNIYTLELGVPGILECENVDCNMAFLIEYKRGSKVNVLEF